jgi:hypothetical protein
VQAVKLSTKPVLAGLHEYRLRAWKYQLLQQNKHAWLICLGRQDEISNVTVMHSADRVSFLSPVVPNW